MTSPSSDSERWVTFGFYDVLSFSDHSDHLHGKWNRRLDGWRNIAIALITPEPGFFFFSITLDAQQFHKQLSAAEKEHILEDAFTEVRKAETMPANVKQAFAKITAEPSFALANPGQKYQVTDVVVGRGLPRRRLVFAGVRGDEWLVHYELGGIGHSYCVLLFKVDAQNRLQFVWGGVGSHGAKNLDELRKMVAAGQFADEMQNDW